ncbi:MAG: multidrug efflux SMR transporter [Raoultibacter sp.]
MPPFVLLAISIAAEVFGVSMLKLSESFTILGPSLLTVVGYAISFSLLIIILKKMPLGLVYGIWGGAGTVLTTVIGIAVWGDAFSLYTGLGIALIVVGIYLLNKGTEEIEEAREVAKKSDAAAA